MNEIVLWYIEKAYKEKAYKEKFAGFDAELLDDMCKYFSYKDLTQVSKDVLIRALELAVHDVG